MIGVIADDFTGAAEIGAVGLRHGLRAEVVVGGEPSGHAELVCLDSDSRSCTAAEAGRRTAEAAQHLVRAGADWIYKKTDSVLRGQVMAELAAIMRQLDQPRALLLPANPSLGRIIKDGQYYVRGKPISETEFARDPEYPRTSSRVLDLLANEAGVQVRVCRHRDVLPSTGVVVGEVATPDEVTEWAGRREAGTLVAGGAEFFAALLAATGLKSKPVELSALAGQQELKANASETTSLFVCGTASEVARGFAAQSRQAGVPVFWLPERLVGGGELRDSELDSMTSSVVGAIAARRRAILTVGLPTVRGKEVARGLAIQLVRFAASVLGRTKVDWIYAEGGATAVELARRMRWLRMDVQQELSLGVVGLRVGDGRTLTVKPGSYTWPSCIFAGA